jgi:hypothetical protein
MGLDTKTYWLTDRQSQCDFDFDFDPGSRWQLWVVSYQLKGIRRKTLFKTERLVSEVL